MVSSSGVELGISPEPVILATVLVEGTTGRVWQVGKEEGSSGEGQVAVAADVLGFGAAEEFDILQTAGCGRGLLNDGELAELVGCGEDDEADGDVVDS